MTLTAESMNLFSASKHLLFDEVCLNEALVNEASSGEKHAAVSVEEVTEI